VQAATQQQQLLLLLQAKQQLHQLAQSSQQHLWGQPVAAAAMPLVLTAT
jgi:hypothetical protein